MRTARRRRPGIVWAHSVLLLGCLLASMLAPMAIQAGSQSDAGECVVVLSQATDEDLATLADHLQQWLPEQLARYQVPGAALALVRPGQIMLLAGYGVADLDSGVSVDPERTVFPLGALAKPVTAAALLQLSDLGQVDLFADLAVYLGDLLPASPFAEPVTLASLLTETSGYAETSGALLVHKPAELLPLGEWLQMQSWASVSSPGEFYGASGLGYALAGYVLEVATGQSYSDYVEANLLRPLGMYHSSVQQPLPADLALDLATGYQVSAGKLHAVAPTCAQAAPAVGLNATAADMARLAAALLGEGSYGSGRILFETSAQEMLRRQFALHPQLPGITFSFHEVWLAGSYWVERQGDTEGFTSSLWLSPEAGLGVLLIYNSQDPALREALVDEVLAQAPALQVAASELESETVITSSAQDLDRLAGSYRNVRLAADVPHLARALIERSSELQVSVVRPANGTGLLALDGGAGGLWAAVSPWVFQHVGVPQEYLVFTRDAAHEQRLLAGIDAYRRLAWWETLALQRILLGVNAAALLSYLIVRLWAVLHTRRDAGLGPQARHNKLLRIARSWLVVVALLLLVGGTGSLLAVSQADALGPALLSAVCRWILTLGAGLAMAVPLWSLALWITGTGAAMERAHYTCVSLVGIALIWSLSYWGLLLWS